LKEHYLTPGDIEENAVRLIPESHRPAEDRGEADRRGPEFDLARAALLIIDMQAYFLDEESHAFVPDAPAIVSGLAGLARRFGAAGRPVVMTRHSNTEDDAGMMKEWWGDLLEPGSPGTALEPILEELSTDVVAKAQYDAFHETALENILRSSGSEQVVVTGVMTHLCVETTARSAFVRGFAVFVPADGTATYDRDFHAASLLNLSHGTAAMTTCSGLMETGQV
jgi:isochorismate hydrolase